MYISGGGVGWVDWSRLRRTIACFQYVKGLIDFERRILVSHRESELKGLDQTACGMPDVSYHGENAWQMRNEVSSRPLGVLYSRVGVGGSDCFIAYNMHWLAHVYALPFPAKERYGALLYVRQKGT